MDLKRRMREVRRRALDSGALLSLPTDSHTLEEAGVPFVVRALSQLARKDAAKEAAAAGRTPGGDDFNPFLPYEEELYVGHLAPAHVALLNKFNVVDDHLLIVTREYADQEALLDQDDFSAAWQCLSQVDGLVFYNGGPSAGASQRHKHLQLIPLPLAAGQRGMPIAPWLVELGAEMCQIDAAPFEHLAAALPAGGGATVRSFELYRAMVHALGLEAPGSRQRAPYNLLLTRQQILVVPRRVECFEGISVNAIGFAGGLLVRTAAQLQRIREVGPIAVLAAVGCPR